MKVKILLCIIIFYSQSFSIEKHIIGARGVGFFSNFFAVLMHLIGCKKNNLIPVVYWDYLSPYYAANDNSYNNVWEYYFEQVSNLSFEKNDKIYRNYHFADTPYIHWKMPKYVYNFKYDFKKNMHNTIHEYIKIKKHVLIKIESFYKKYIQGEKIVGIHVRGTNKIEESPRVDIDIFLKIATKYVDNGYKIFIASDEYIIIEKFRKIFPGRVICYNAHRSSNSLPHYLGRDRNDPLNIIIGEDVLIEAILLSKCDIFIHSVSNVSTAVLFFNPELEHIFIDPTKKLE